MVRLEERVGYLEGKIDSLATKAGVERLGGELRREMGELRGEMGELRGEVGVLRGEVGELRGEFKAFRLMLVVGFGFVGVGLAALQIVLQVAM